MFAEPQKRQRGGFRDEDQAGLDGYPGESSNSVQTSPNREINRVGGGQMQGGRKQSGGVAGHELAKRLHSVIQPMKITVT
jgi:hypothetical protein